MQTADEVMALVRQELGEETAAALAAALARQEPADQAMPGLDATREDGSTLNWLGKFAELSHCKSS